MPFMSSIDVTIPRAEKNLSAEEMLEGAQRALRCIEWSKFSEELMKTSEAKSPDGRCLFDLSCPVKSGERIDFFISHSWHDDAGQKWAKLKDVVGHFQFVAQR